MVIDALRFDFLLHMPNATAANPFFHNHMPIIQHLRQTRPSSSLLFQSRADPPTTTTQRIKGIMTGSLPTFIDAGSNFASSAVGEDHLLRHLNDQFKNIYFMGDDTWMHLFPESLNRTDRVFGSDSFKMFDLHTVDNRILSRLWPLMDQPDNEWEIAIMHFLGVDHCGHTYGPSHFHMTRKLTQMNGVIERLISHIDEDTLFVLMGDHGMSVEGDHGGESPEEVMSGLFVYSGRNLTMAHMDTDHAEYYARFFQRIHSIRAEALGYDFTSITERLGYNASAYPMISQIHLVPTLSYLLNMPIPFGNLGGLIPDLLMPAPPLSLNKATALFHMMEQFRMNTLQVYDYLTHYYRQTQHPGFSPQKLAPMLQHLYRAEKSVLDMSKWPSFSAAANNLPVADDDEELLAMLEQTILEYDKFLMGTIKYCEAIWAQFDVGCMCVGIVLLCLSTCANLWLIQKRRTTFQFALSMATWTSAFGFGMAVLRYTALPGFMRNRGWFEKMELLDWMGISLAMAMAMMTSTMDYGRYSILRDGWSWVILIVAVTCQGITLASNSFVIWEDRIIRFLLATLCLWLIFRIINRGDPLKRIGTPLCILAWVRLTGLTGQCREEQFPHCVYIHNGHINTNTYIYGVFVFYLVLMRVLSQRFAKRAGKGMLKTTLHQISLCIVFVRLAVDVYDSSHDSQLIEQFSAVVGVSQGWLQSILNVHAPRIVYAGTAGITAISMSKTSQTGEDIVSKRREFWGILYLWSTMLAMLQKPLGSLIVLSIPCLIELLANEESDLLIRLALTHCLGHHVFFVTGHQVIFTSLPWKAAFIGFDDMSYYGGAILVLLSTLTGYILAWISWAVILAEDQGEKRQPFMLLLVIFQSIPTFLSAIFILVLRRHLMTWKIFAPRFLLQAILSVGSHVAALVLQHFI
ncbi:mannose-ethanolamine phosphotransferase gpi13 [Apophysomyces ossiformis]|uniref:Mannose-ethanolamine phosphotransferase gpi13 n=1 Tax=Apophysomyces ossiformis TaxID=679940 RepID=A0A8H7BU79_9FUNG|nr:mannose-ethanolamine phosphotransferase gpi13 [Apophysomyces ossiformis]